MNPSLNPRNLPAPQFTMKRVAAGCYDIQCPALGLDAHLSPESGGYVLDVFRADCADADEAHVASEELESATFENIANALRAVALIHGA